MPKVKREAQEQLHQEASRLLSAAEFLLSIPIGTKPAASGREPTGAAHDGYPDRRASDGRNAGPNPPSNVLSAETGTGVDVSVRLRGDKFRHITSRGARSSNVFASALVKERVHEGRLMFSAARAYPSAVVSFVQYDPAAEASRIRERQAAAARLLLGAAQVEGDGQALPSYLRGKAGRSYQALLRGKGGVLLPTTGASRRHGHSEQDSDDPGYCVRYDPVALDDPGFDRAGARLAYQRDGFAVSILAFRLASTAKDDGNGRFAQSFPWLDFGPGQSLTLSKIRSLKGRALDLWWAKGWEVATVALAIVAFERLVWKRLVTKANRRLAMATCLLLAFKHNEATGEGDGRVPRVWEVLDAIEATFAVPRKAILKAEFPVFVHLAFALHAPESHVLPHMDRLLSSKGTTVEEYMQQDGGQDLGDTASFQDTPWEAQPLVDTVATRAEQVHPRPGQAHWQR